MPPHGGPLESLFVLVTHQRRYAELLGTRAIIQAVLPTKKERQDPAITAFEKYCDTVFPFMERAGEMTRSEEHKRLKDFVKHPARIFLQPMWKQQAENAKRVQKLRRFKLQPKYPGVS